MKGEPLFLVMPFPFWASDSRNKEGSERLLKLGAGAPDFICHIWEHTPGAPGSLHHQARRTTQGAPGHNHRAGLKVTHCNVAPDHIGALSKRLTVVKWAAKPGPQDSRGRKHRCYGAKKTSLKGALRGRPRAKTANRT